MTTSHEPPAGWDPEREEAEAEERPARGHRGWWIFGSVAVVVSMVRVVWFGISATEDPVIVQDVGFERPGKHEIVMVFDVTREPGTTLSCTITAMDSEYGRVGTTKHTVPASSERTTRVRARVETTTTPATATADECTPVD